jgi:cytochrome bd-type quinol oxidase subunit 2
MSMSGIGEFGKTARDLARNPLGVIALFIVLIYGMATIIVVEGNKLTSFQRDVFVWFLSTYPVIVLLTFAWLVNRHSEKLYAPQDFKNQAHWVGLQRASEVITAVATTDVVAPGAVDATEKPAAMTGSES